MQELRKDVSIGSLYGQGISGGKSKMMSLFQKSEKKSVLIGTIDSYIDESSLWQGVDSVIIAKVPFDPPTDPYFLARTVGMKNNFEEYSAPVALATMNTLIGRIHRANPKIELSTIDERIASTNW
jgi:Rad3-related DNA helicase